ncbi:hypothetical protein ACFLT1_03915 [Bacteroidota bacterium]
MLFQIGAGKIGRSFIAQIFNKAGYRIVFADIDPCLINALNDEGSYKVIFKSNDFTETYNVSDITAIEFNETSAVVNAIINADTIAVSVGKNSLFKLAGLLGEGISKRYAIRKDDPIDLILAENIRDASNLLYNEISKYTKGVPIDSYVGFVETSIGKMVPLMTQNQLKEDPLAIFTEPYNQLILDKNAFRGAIPDVPDLQPKENMKAWVDKKIFIHNMGHATLAYQCNFHYPDIKATWEALEINELKNITRKTMQQSARILMQMYPEEFSIDQIDKHIADLLKRFANRALGDTIYRVGRDLHRKLGRDDRFIVPIMNALNYGSECKLILEAWVKGCYFNAVNEEGRMFTEDKKFKEKYAEDPVTILRAHCNFDPKDDTLIFDMVSAIIKHLNK